MNYCRWLAERNKDLFEIIFSGLISFLAGVVSMPCLSLLAETLITEPTLSKFGGSGCKSILLPDWLVDINL
jgi:hypothetical protein